MDVPTRLLVVFALLILAVLPASARAVSCPGADPCPYTGFSYVGAHAPSTLDYPYDVAVDGQGNVYVATEHPGVEKFSPTAFQMHWGTRGMDDNQFQFPTGIAVDGEGNVYTADPNANRVQKFTAGGDLLARWGGNSGTGGFAFAGPYRVAVDNAGNLYVADSFNNRVVKRGPEGEVLGVWTAGHGGTALSQPRSIAVDSATGIVYVAGSFSSTIQRLQSSDGTPLEPVVATPPADFANPQPGEFNYASDLEVDAFGTLHVLTGDAVHQRSGGAWTARVPIRGGVGLAVSGGSLYVVEQDTRSVLKYSSTGVVQQTFGAPGHGELLKPEGTAVDAGGNLWVADTDMNRVQKFGPDDAPLGAWGAAGANGASGKGNGEFSNPRDLDVMPSGDLLVADTGNRRLQQLTENGTFVRAWATTFSPDHVAVDAAGHPYVADVGAGRVHRLTLADDGTYTVDYTIGAGTSATGGLSWARGVAVDAEHLYVADDRQSHITSDDPESQVKKYKLADGAFVAKWQTRRPADQAGQGNIRAVAVGGGSVYTVDSDTYQVRKWSLAGAFEAGWGGATFPTECPGKLGFPEGVSYGNGSVYVSDTQSNQIQRFKLTGGSLLACDTTMPNLQATAPATDATVGGSPAFSGTAGTAAGDASTVTVRIFPGVSSLPGGVDVPGFLKVLRRFTAQVQPDGSWSVTPPTPFEDGAYRFEAEQVDAAGNGRITTMRPFTVSGSAGGDVTPPDVDLLFPSPAGTTVTVDDTPLLKGTGGGAAGDAATVAVSVYRRTIQGDTKILDFPSVVLVDGAWSVQLEGTLTNGTYAVQATQKDLADNVGDTGRIPFTVEAPTVTAPGEGIATNDDTPTILGTAADYAGAGALVALEVRNQGGTLVSTQNADRTGKAWALTLGTLADGTYTVLAKQSDGTGAQGRSAVRTFRIDTRRPSIGQSRPVNRTNTVDHTPLLSGTAGTREGDEIPIQIEYRKWNGSDWEAPKFFDTTRNGGKWEVEMPQLEDGTWFTRAYQWDTAGNWGSSSGTTFGVYTDSTPPAPTVNSPSDGGYVNSVRPTLSGAAGAANGDLPEVRIEIYRFKGSGWEFQRWEKTQRTGNGWTYKFGSDLEVGSWFVRVYQSDEAGNTGYSTGTVFNIDQFAPKPLTIDRPAEGATVNNTFSLAGSASGGIGDLPTIDLELQKFENGVYTPLPGSPFRVNRDGWTWSLQRTLPNGTYFARIYQGDQAGNSAHSEGRLFKVQSPPPPPGQNAGTGVGEAGCQKSLTFGPLSVKGTCLERVGLTWVATGTANTVDINGLRIVPADSNAKVVIDPLNLRIAASGRAKVQLGPVGVCASGLSVSMCAPDAPDVQKVLGPVVLYEGEFEWVWQTKIRAGLPNIGGLELPKFLPDLGKFAWPQFSAPQLPSIPALNAIAPSLPKLPEIPGLSFPDLSKVSVGDLPRFDIPSIDQPNVQIPNVLVPNFKLPPLCIGTGGGATGVFGMPLEGRACVALLEDRSGVEVTAAAKLPGVFGGVSGDTKLTVKSGLLRLDGLNIAVPEAWFGAVGFKDVGVKYTDAAKLWEGGATIYLPPLGDAGVGATVGVQNGSLANLGVKWRPGNFAIGTTGLFLNEIGMGYRSSPSSEIFGNLAISAGPEVAGCAALQVKTNAKYNFSEVYFQINGRVYLACMEFAGADFEWHGNGYLWGKLQFKPPEVAGFGASAKIEGWVDRDHAFNLEGAGSFYGPGVSVNGDAVISGDARSWTDTYGGAAVCGRIDARWFGKHEVGIGRTWDQKNWNILTGTCDIGPYRVEYEAAAVTARASSGPRARAAQAAPQSVTVKAGEDVKLFGFDGAGAPPKVTLTGPDGLKVVTPAGPEGLETDRVLLMQDPTTNTTHILVGKPAAGEWKVELQAGSRPLTAVKGAGALPEPKVDASVSGSGNRRTVRWKVKPIPGQKVQFVEEGDGVARTIGLATKAKGSKTFTPGPAKDRSREVWAIVLQNDVPRAKFKVGAYRAPSSRPTKPGRVIVKRKKTGLQVKWLPAVNAKEYLVRVTSSGATIQRSTSKRSILIPNVGMFSGAKVEVVGRSQTGELGPAGKRNAKKPKGKKPRRKRR